MLKSDCKKLSQLPEKSRRATQMPLAIYFALCCQGFAAWLKLHFEPIWIGQVQYTHTHT